MAAPSDSASRPKLSVATLHQISKDFQGSGNPIPLSPQWLLPKGGEAKGMEVGEHHCNLQPLNGDLPDTLKTSGNVEVMHDVPMKKDVFRPSVLDMESDRRDRWRDEERDTNSSLRKDHWKDGEKDLGDNRKADRWIENPSNRNFGESRRVSSEQRMDSNNLDGNFDQRRESKWDTRWGPDDKEPEGMREKWVDSEKDGEILQDRGSLHSVTQGKEDMEGNQYRPWRSASSQSRGRGGPHHHQSLAPSKQGSTFSYGRGRGENTPPTFSVSRGRSSSIGSSMNYSNPIHSMPIGLSGDKLEGVQSEPYMLKYARTKLLDVYRTTDGRSCQSIPDGFVPVPSLTLEEPVEPLALCVPNPEEMVVLKGIDTADVISSGAPQIIRDGQSSLDVGLSRRNKLGTREYLPQDLDEKKEEGSEGTKVSQINFSDGSPYERQLLFHGSQLNRETSQDREISAGNKLKSEAFREDGNYTEADKFSSGRESRFQKNISVHPSATWKNLSPGEYTHPSLPDWRENPNDVSFRTPEKGLLQPSKNLTDELGNSFANQLYTKDNIRGQVGDNPIIGRQLSGVFGEEQRLMKPVHSSPEDLRLYYLDPSGVIQGPFTGIDIIGWFEAGYFGLDLLVRPESAPRDSPFSSLGDVMPHLRAKAKPPPGFGGPKQTEDASSNLSFIGFAQHHSGLSDMELIRNETRLKETENRFLESLMSANLSRTSFENSSFSEGMQVHFGDTSHNVPATGVEGGNNLILMAKRMAFERQKCLPNKHHYRQGRDAASIISKSEIIEDSQAPHSKLLTPILDNPHQTPYSQNADMMSILQGISDGPSSGTKNAAASWSGLTGQCVSDAISQIGMQHNQNFPTPASFGLQQQRLQLEKPPSFTNLFSQAIENPSMVSAPEKLLSSNLSQEQQLLNNLQQQQLLSSNLSQDPHALNMLQQQYLLQLYSQAPAPTQQMSLLDKLLLLNQQQKQEEQQQLLRQQQLLSHILSEQQSHQRFGDPSYGQVHTSPVPIRNAFTDPSRIQPSQEMLHNGSQLPILNVHGEHATNFGNMPLQVSQDVNFNVSLEGPSLPLPHQIIGTHLRSTSAALSEQGNDILQKELLAVPKIVQGSPLPNMMTRSIDHTSLLERHVSDSEIYAPKSIEQGTEQTINVDRTFTSLTSEADSELLESAEFFVGLSGRMGGISVSDTACEVKMKLDSVYEKLQVERDACNDEPSKQEVENVGIHEPRKVSEKKSKKQNTLKLQTTSDQGNEVAKNIQLSKQPESRKSESGDLKLESNKGAGQILFRQRSSENESKKIVSLEVVDAPQIQSSVPENFSRDGVETIGIKSDMLSSQSRSGQAWKPAPGFKAKSLLEIQEEELKKAQSEAVVSDIATSVNSMSLSTSWTGIVGYIGETQKGSVKHETFLNSKGKKSQLHDLLDEDVFPKFSEGEVSDSVYSASSAIAVSKHSESTNDDNFIDAKETKKSRKKAAKAKGVGTKASSPVTSVDITTGSSPIEKVKSSRQVQQEKEVLPTIPSGPSLSDFVFWKGELTNSSPTPAPAWSTDSGKVSKPVSLRDIQKEQERISSQHPSQMPTPQKSQPTQISRAPPIPVSSQPSSQSKNKGDEDLFWGPVDSSKQEMQQVDYPQLATQSSWETRATAEKGTSLGSLSRQRSLTGKAYESSLSTSTSVQSSLRGKRGARTKHSEAMDFRDWCESECIRLIGSKDTSFLEFCLKQSRSEAELLLAENLGSYDPEHEFIDKFLNYKELLSADVLETAFQTQNDRKTTGFNAKDLNAEYANPGAVDENSTLTTPDGTSKGGGKKKGKKGKKVSTSILGFNVVSNRIMMGEIQTVED